MQQQYVQGNGRIMMSDYCDNYLIHIIGIITKYYAVLNGQVKPMLAPGVVRHVAGAVWDMSHSAQGLYYTFLEYNTALHFFLKTCY